MPSWTNGTKDASAWSDGSRHSSSFANGTKDVSSYANQSQSSTSFVDEIKVLGFLLLETGSYILQETGDRLILDLNFASTTWANQAES